MHAIDFFPEKLCAEFTQEERDRLQNLVCTGLCIDTRILQSGDFFVGIDGTETTGAFFLDNAIHKGARGALISQKGFEDLQSQGHSLPDIPLWISQENPNVYIGQMASLFYPACPEFLMAVTGTNGKTSVSFFAHQIMYALGFSSAFLGTIGLWTLDDQTKGQDAERSKLTSPDSVSLHKILSKLALRGIQSVALEASSHGLDQRRLSGLRFQAAAFTNFSQDHLDYHPGMAEYFEAKCLLFRDLIKKGGWAVLNADIEEVGSLTQIAQEKCHRLFTYGWKGSDLRILNYTPHMDSLEVTLDLWGHIKTIELPLIGDYQVHNALCALGLVLGALAVDPTHTALLDRALESLGSLQAPPGRLEWVGATQTKARVYVDYAHTPDAFERVLKTLRPFTQGKLWILFGCGGDRDAQKRPLMGKMAYDYADYIVITDDNPRSEEAYEIRAQIQELLPKDAENIFVMGDREKAIEITLSKLKEGDVLLLAGKGHERGQIIGNQVYPFNDKDVTLDLLKKMKG